MTSCTDRGDIGGKGKTLSMMNGSTASKDGSGKKTDINGGEASDPKLAQIHNLRPTCDLEVALVVDEEIFRL